MRGREDAMSEAMRKEARRLFDVAVAAADPGRAVARALEAAPVSGKRVWIVAVGKAAWAMAAAARERLDAHVTESGTIVVTNAENAAPLEGAEVHVAGHPVPDEGGLRAAGAVEAMLTRTEPGDVVLALISGGGSALLPAPVEGVSLADKAEASRLMLGAGLDITEMNSVRQHLSRLKGGGLARAAAPARVVALILSDVIGDDLRVIASGPTVAPICTRAEARALLVARGLLGADAGGGMRGAGAGRGGRAGAGVREPADRVERDVAQGDGRGVGRRDLVRPAHGRCA
jgi:glycerate 2-kinase